MTIVQLLEFLIPEFSQTMAMLSLYGAVALALVQCFFGYRLQQAWFSLLVFAASALLSFAVSRAFLPDRLWLCLLIGLGVGLLISLFTYRLCQLAAFVVAFSSVFGAVGSVLETVNPTASVIVALILGVLAGILAAKFQYKAVILLTSAGNGWKAAMLLRQCIPTLEPAMVLILAAVLIAAGMIFQFATAGKKRRR